MKANTPKTFKKGDRVKFTEEGEIKHGFVLKGGSSKIHVNLDSMEWNKYLIGHASIFDYSDEPAPIIKETLAGNHLQFNIVFSKVAADDGYPFEVTITRDGIKLITLKEPADGSPVSLSYHNKASNRDFEDVFKMSCDWLKVHSNCSQMTYDKLCAVDDEWKQVVLIEISEWMSNFEGVGIHPKKYAKPFIANFLPFIEN